VVSHNLLDELPETIRGLQALAHLDASSNNLVALPAAISELTALTHLDVSGNSLSKVRTQRRRTRLNLRCCAPAPHSCACLSSRLCARPSRSAAGQPVC
jgi:Leucine-rich repeat (LRR) protein